MRAFPLLALLLLGAASATAHADNKALARDSYREGTRQYDVDEFKLALEAFKHAYVAYEDAAFLFNIAQCYRQLGDKTEAVRSYKTYLRKVPGAPNRADVEKMIGDLEQAIAQERSFQSSPPHGTLEEPLERRLPRFRRRSPRLRVPPSSR